MARRKNVTEEQILDYIKGQSKSDSVFQKPISKIAEETRCSTSTVWRVIQKLQDKRVIKVVKSKSATDPDTIYYLGDQDNSSPLIEQIKSHMNSISVLLEELSLQLKRQEDTIDTMKYELEVRRAQKERILSAIED